MVDRGRRDLVTASLSGLALACLPKMVVAAGNADRWGAVFARMPAELAALVAQPAHAIQLRWLRIHRDADGQSMTTIHNHGLTPRRWFPAASVTKLPMALLMAEAVQECGGSIDSVLRLHAPPRTGNWGADEFLSETLRRGLNRTFAVSDNTPFNRWYELLGGDRIHRRLSGLGYPHARLIARLGSSDFEANRYSGGGAIEDASGRVLAAMPSTTTAIRRFPFGDAKLGSGWQNDDGTVIPGPRDFSRANFLPLNDSLRMLQAFMSPESVPPHQRWHIDGALRAQLLRALALRPRDSTLPIYPEKDFADGYARWFFVGDGKERYPDGVTVFGKCGMAYGSLSEVAYVVDRESGAEFMLAASIYCNADGILNDDRYEYDNLGIPFMTALARAVLEYERDLLRNSRLFLE